MTLKQKHTMFYLDLLTMKFVMTISLYDVIRLR